MRAENVQTVLEERLEAEAERVRQENQRRSRELPRSRHIPYDVGEMFIRSSFRREACKMLTKSGVFPKSDDPCLEVGVGRLGWLPSLIEWGVEERSIAGIDCDDGRVALTRASLPHADVRVGNAARLPWADNHFHLVVASLTFSSMLDDTVRRMASYEIFRVLRPGGALLWYDFAFDNPWNKNVRKVDRRELIGLFPDLKGPIERMTLAPPLARRIAPRSWTLATTIEAILPMLCSHLIAVMVKQ